MELAKSLERQTIKPFEWFIVRDSTTEWVRSKHLPTFSKILACQDTRQATKKNLAIDEATGDYILIIDSDQEAEPRVIEQCLEKANKGYNAVTIPEVFQEPKSYLQECYYLIRTLYAQNVEGIPRFFRREDLLQEKFNPDYHYAEDPELWERLRAKTGESTPVESRLIHKEKFSLFYNLKKVRIATEAGKKLKKEPPEISTPKRLSIRKILGATPMRLMPGVMLVLLLRMLARRF